MYAFSVSVSGPEDKTVIRVPACIHGGRQKKKKKSKQPYKITASHIKIARKKMQIMDDREGMTLGEEGLRR